MIPPYSTFAVICIAGSILMALAIYGWFHRSARRALPFVVCMLLSAELMLASALSMTSPTYESAIF